MESKIVCSKSQENMHKNQNINENIQCITILEERNSTQYSHIHKDISHINLKISIDSGWEEIEVVQTVDHTTAIKNISGEHKRSHSMISYN